MRILALSANADCQQELIRIGVDPQAFSVLLAKKDTLAVKLDHLHCSTAGILKQTALALGADCAVHRDVIRGRKRKSDALLFATRRQLQRICERLAQQPPAARALGSGLAELVAQYDARDFVVPLGHKRYLRLSERTHLMGILNVTPDSFADGGKYSDADDAVAHGLRMAEAGADIIDIGAESTRPGASTVPARTEIDRLLPVLKRLRRKVHLPISIDTQKSEVARVALAEGADIINDIAGLRFDPLMPRLIAEAKTTCVMMHIKGRPRTMQRNPRYADLMAEIVSFLRRSLDIARWAGIAPERTIVDPGIGFGKSTEDNFTILRRLSELRSLGRPILVGVSRKSFIGTALSELYGGEVVPPAQRLEGTLAACVTAVLNGAHILRVHDIEAVRRAAVIADRVILRRRAR